MTHIRLLETDKMPATHVLIVGVGYYRHLRGGPEVNDAHLGMSILYSPPVSAMQLARWMLNSHGTTGGGHNNPDAPLATLEILVSSEQTGQLTVEGTVYDIERASLDNVRAGFDRWLDEVKRHQDNVGVLYFCGHGMTGVGPDHILLLDDHGAMKRRPFQTGSFNISETVRAMWREVEAQLYIIIDACRNYNATLGQNIGSLPDPLLDAGANSANVNRGTTFIESTTEGHLAHANNHQVSQFTTGLLQALSGYSGVPEAGTRRWLVNGNALNQAMPGILAMIGQSAGGARQPCSINTSGEVDLPLHVTTAVPRVKVEINLTPVHLRPTSGYEIQKVALIASPPITGGRCAGVWSTETEKGIYFIRIASDSTEMFSSGIEHLDPPMYCLPVEVRP